MKKLIFSLIAILLLAYLGLALVAAFYMFDDRELN